MSAIDNATPSVTLFCLHGQALMEFRKTLIQTNNILYDRPTDFSAAELGAGTERGLARRHA